MVFVGLGKTFIGVGLVYLARKNARVGVISNLAGLIFCIAGLLNVLGNFAQ